MIRITLIELAIVFFVSCVGITKTNEIVAPGAPGQSSVWAYAGKTGIGTSYETYTNSSFSNEGESGIISKVWFSIAQGILTETMYGLIHEAQIKEMQFVVVGPDFVDFEKNDTESTIEYLDVDESGRPLSLAYKIITRDKDGRYEIEKHIFTNPDDQALFIRAIFRSREDGIRPYLYLNPHVNNTGSGDHARVDSKAMHAFEGDTHLTLLSDQKFNRVTTGFVGASDGISDLNEHKKLSTLYNTTGEEGGNVAMLAELKPMTEEGLVYDFSIGFGNSGKASRNAAAKTLTTGYTKVLAHYNGEGKQIGWEDYLASLPELARMQQTATDNGKLLNVSAMVLKAQEDKSNAGAIIASLSNPWGETSSADKAGTGYKAVWPRDFYQCAMAFLALGDTQTPLVAFEYLHKVQVSDKMPENKGINGWFLQKTHVDGTLEWASVQLDQTAMPIMLGWKLWHAGILSNEKMEYWYTNMLKPAANFLSDGGEVNLDWNRIEIVPPKTQQERWEEQSGYSPSTIAAIITGLTAAADIASEVGDGDGANKFAEHARKYEKMIEQTMFTTTGYYKTGVANGNYFIRVTQNDDPNDHKEVIRNNGKPAIDETKVMDAGFLELVRYGVRKARAQSILESLDELDNQDMDENLKIKYNFKFGGDEAAYPGWRRYGNDGYGESIADGSNYGVQDSTHRGRVWPIFTGERGHYELARSIESGAVNSENIRNTYIKAMEYFANDGMMLPEQVWDGIGVNSAGYKTGEGTNSATPLAWSHAEYIKLVRSVADQKVWDRYPIVENMFSK